MRSVGDSGPNVHTFVMYSCGEAKTWSKWSMLDSCSDFLWCLQPHVVLMAKHSTQLNQLVLCPGFPRSLILGEENNLLHWNMWLGVKISQNWYSAYIFKCNFFLCLIKVLLLRVSSRRFEPRNCVLSLKPSVLQNQTWPKSYVFLLCIYSRLCS